MQRNRQRRKTTVGNLRADMSVLRKNLSNVNPLVAATLRNAVPEEGDKVTSKDSLVNTKNIPTAKLKKLSSIISNNITSIANLREITPYIDKADLLWRTILLFPNGKQDRILEYNTLPSNIKSTPLHDALLPIWEDYFTNDYKIEERLPDIVSDVLINTGSFIFFSLSRPGLDYLINGSELANVRGNESLIQESVKRLETEFTTNEQGQIRAYNKGHFVIKDKSKLSRVTGIESLLNDFNNEREVEFDLLNFGGIEGCSITLTDNPAVLYLQKLNDIRVNRRVEDVVGIENLDFLIEGDNKSKKPSRKEQHANTINLTEEESIKLAEEIYKERHIGKQEIQYVKDNDSLSIQPYGRGITFEVPSEAAITVNVNGDASKQMDLIILLDENGNFLKTTNDPNFYQAGNMKSEVKPKSGTDDYIIAGLKKVHSGEPCDFDMSEFAELVKSSIIDRFTSSIISGKGNDISITIDEETNKIFLARMFKKQGVRCLYVPGEAVTYISLKRNRLGLGESLVTNAKSHIARIAAYDIADALANIEGAQPHNRLNITPDEHDSDPHQSVATARAAFFETNPRLHNLLSTAQISIPQIVDSIRESSLTVTVNASENKHMAVPETSIEELRKENFRPVDDQSRQHTLDQIANYLMFPRSWLDVTEDSNNFKIEAVTENEIVFNQAATWGEELANQLMDAQRKHVRVNALVLKRLIDTIKENKKLWTPDSKVKLEGDDTTIIKTILADFMNGIYCETPTPQSVERTDKIVQSLEAVEKLVGSWMELSAVKDNFERVARLLEIEAEDYSSEEIVSKVRSALLAEAFRRYNLPMPFDDSITSPGGSGIATLVQEVIKQHNSTAEFLAKFTIDKIDADKKTYKAFAKKLKKAQDTLNSLKAEEEEEADDGITEDVPSDELGEEDIPEGEGDEDSLGDEESFEEDPEVDPEGEEDPEDLEEEDDVEADPESEEEVSEEEAAEDPDHNPFA